jgi:AcrR family transcriptional regulator
MRVSREQGKEQTRRALLTAAHAMFAGEGYHATTLDRVAETAGFTKGAVYSAFASKADLFLEVYEERLHARAARAGAAAARITSIGDFARAGSSEWERVLREDRGWTAALTEFWVFASRDEALRDRFLIAHRAWRNELASLVGTISGRSPEEAERVAITVIALGNGLALEGLLGEDVSGVLSAAMQQVLR